MRGLQVLWAKKARGPGGLGSTSGGSTVGEGQGLRTAPKPPKGSEREQVRNGRRTEIQGMAGPLDQCPWMKGNGKGGQGEAFSLLERY